MKIKIEKFILLFFLILSLALVGIWFKDFKFIATGEEHLWLWNPERTLLRYLYLWVERGLGQTTPVYLPKVTVVFFASILQNHFPPWFIEALVISILLMTALLGMYFLTKTMLDRNAYTTSTFASLFYLFNLFTLSQVLNRFQFPGIFAWAYLPLFILLWIKWLDTGNKKWIILLILSSVIYSNVFGAAAFIFSLWVPVLIWILIRVIKIYPIKKELFKLILRVGGGIVFWIIANVWWIYPYITISESSSSDLPSFEANFGSLKAVSQFFKTKDIIFLKQSSIFNRQNWWGDLYKQPLVFVISVSIVIITIFGLVKSRKFKNWPFLLILLLVGWFISKGTNPPLGEFFFKNLFNIHPIFQALRNSYEKFGIVFLLPYCLFWAIGVNWLISRFKDFRGRVLMFSFVLFLVYFLLVLPMWRGDVFGAGVYNVKVRVPDYYREANEFLNAQKNDGRILIVPTIPGDGMRYNWEGGYFQGIEPSEYLFDKSVISKTIGPKYHDDKYWKLHFVLAQSENYHPLLEEMNIKYVILNYDMDWEIIPTYSLQHVREILDSDKDLMFINKFGNLWLYENKRLKNPNLFLIEPKRELTLKYKKISPVRYTVEVKNNSSPFKLIFKNSFHESWIARIDGKEIKNHFLVYDYANGWLVEELGDYKIEVVFKVWPWE